jgi:hypothetical protein
MPAVRPPGRIIELRLTKFLPPLHPATFFFSARNFAHRFFVALPILARAAADRTRFFTTFSSLLVESPSALAAARTPFN